MNRSGWRSHLTALLTALIAGVGLLSLSTAPAWAVAGTVTEFNVPSGTAFGITAGPDGTLWFTDSAGAIGRITPSGSITLFPVPGSRLEGVTAGPDGNLGFTDDAGTTAKIGRITTAGSFTEFPLPTASSVSQFITAGPDGNLWFTEDVLSGKGNNNKIDGKIGRITTAGSFTEFPLPKNCAFEFCGALGITAGPDGNLWFTEAANDVGRITTAGSFTQFRAGGACVANEGCEAFGITSGPY